MGKEILLLCSSSILIVLITWRCSRFPYSSVDMIMNNCPFCTSSTASTHFMGFSAVTGCHRVLAIGQFLLFVLSRVIFSLMYFQSLRFRHNPEIWHAIFATRTVRISFLLSFIQLSNHWVTRQFAYSHCTTRIISLYISRVISLFDWHMNTPRLSTIQSIEVHTHYIFGRRCGRLLEAHRLRQLGLCDEIYDVQLKVWRSQAMSDVWGPEMQSGRDAWFSVLEFSQVRPVSDIINILKPMTNRISAI
jgi:hypothetical protein